MASVVLRQDVERVETALREHLDTHTTVEFVRVIHDLRVEIARLRGAGSVGSGEETP